MSHAHEQASQPTIFATNPWTKVIDHPRRKYEADPKRLSDNAGRGVYIPKAPLRGEAGGPVGGNRLLMRAYTLDSFRMA